MGIGLLNFEKSITRFNTPELQEKKEGKGEKESKLCFAIHLWLYKILCSIELKSKTQKNIYAHTHTYLL